MQIPGILLFLFNALGLDRETKESSWKGELGEYLGVVYTRNPLMPCRGRL